MAVVYAGIRRGIWGIWWFVADSGFYGVPVNVEHGSMQHPEYATIESRMY